NYLVEIIIKFKIKHACAYYGKTNIKTDNIYCTFIFCWDEPVLLVIIGTSSYAGVFIIICGICYPKFKIADDWYRCGICKLKRLNISAYAKNACFTKPAVDGLKTEFAEINIEHNTVAAVIKTDVVIVAVHNCTMPDCVPVNCAELGKYRIVFQPVSNIADDA